MGTSLIAFDQAALHTGTLNFACMLQWRFLSAARALEKKCDLGVKDGQMYIPSLGGMQCTIVAIDLVLSSSLAWYAVER